MKNNNQRKGIWLRIIGDTYGAECSIRGFGLSETLGCITIGQ